MILAAILTLALPAVAAKGPPVDLRGPPEGFGIGVVVGSPSGLSMAWKPDADWWVQTAAGWALTDERISLNLDYVLVITSVPTPDPRGMEVPVYLGGGARVRVGEPSKGRLRGTNEAGVGIRVPAGVAMTPANVSVDAFFEIAPVVVLFPNTTAGLDLGLGARIYF